MVAATLLVLSLGLGNPGSSLAGDLVLEYKVRCAASFMLGASSVLHE